MSTNIFSGAGLFSLVGLCILLSWVSVWHFKHKDPSYSVAPIAILNLTFALYVIIAPLFLISMGDTSYAGVELRDTISLSWTGAFVSYCSILVGYRIYKRSPREQTRSEMVSTRVLWLALGVYFFIGVIVYCFIMDITPMMIVQFWNISQDGDSMVSMDGYSKQLCDFCVPACCVALLLFLKQRQKTPGILLVGLILLTVALFLVTGTRYRIAYLILSLGTCYYLYARKRLSITILVSLGLAMIFFMGIVSASRNYYAGLDFDRLDVFSREELFEKGFNDMRVFYSSGALMEDVRSNNLYVYALPLYTALWMPIPRSLFPKKPDATYLVEANYRIWGTASHGIAFMNYADAFYSLSWFGIVLNGLCIGVLAKWFWLFYRKAPNNDFNLLALALFNGFTYVVISRGYLAQQVTIFFLFIVFPLLIYRVILSNFNNKPVRVQHETQ